MSTTGVRILDVAIFSIDKSDDVWAIEGELIFEADLTSPFEVSYIVDEDELDELYIEIEPGNLSKTELKEKIMDAAANFEEL